jgi:hypothetical protein
MEYHFKSRCFRTLNRHFHAPKCPFRIIPLAFQVIVLVRPKLMRYRHFCRVHNFGTLSTQKLFNFLRMSLFPHSPTCSFPNDSILSVINHLHRESICISLRFLGERNKVTISTHPSDRGRQSIKNVIFCHLITGESRQRFHYQFITL